MKTLTKLLIAALFSTISTVAIAQDKPKDPPAPPVVSETLKVEILQAQLVQKDAQLAVVTDQKYQAMMQANQTFAAKVNAACPANGTQRYQLDLTTMSCVPVK